MSDELRRIKLEATERRIYSIPFPALDEAEDALDRAIAIAEVLQVAASHPASSQSCQREKDTLEKERNQARAELESEVEVEQAARALATLLAQALLTCENGTDGHHRVSSEALAAYEARDWK